MADTPIQDREAKLPRVERRGRWYTKYDPEMALEIVVRVSEGETLTSICKRGGPMCATSTFHRWCSEEPELRKAYLAAREISAYSMEDRALDTAQGAYDQPHTSEKLQGAKMLIDQLRWSASRRNPKEFSDKGNQSVVVPVQITTSLDLGAGLVTNHIDGQDIYSLDLKPQEGLEGPEDTAPAGVLPERASEPLRDSTRYDPKAPRKRQLTPLIGMDDELIDPPRENPAKINQWRQHRKRARDKDRENG